MTSYDPLATVTRKAFAEFLDRYAERQTDAAEWEHFVVQHYGDGFLEEVRRCVGRLVNSYLPLDGDAAASFEMLRSWAFLLRSSTNSAKQHPSDLATLDMTPAEAVVLDTILRRYSEQNELAVESRAERHCLLNVQCSLEKNGDRPNWPSLEDAIDELD